MLEADYILRDTLCSLDICGRPGGTDVAGDGFKSSKRWSRVSRAGRASMLVPWIRRCSGPKRVAAEGSPLSFCFIDLVPRLLFFNSSDRG